MRAPEEGKNVSVQMYREVRQGNRVFYTVTDRVTERDSMRVRSNTSRYKSEYFYVYVMCRSGLRSPEGHGSICTADSFYVQSKLTPEHLAPHFLCQKDKSGFHLFEIHYSQ